MIILKSPGKTNGEKENIETIVAPILNSIKNNGDQAILEFTRLLDGVQLDGIRVKDDAIKTAYKQVSRDTILHLQFAARQIHDFAVRQLSCLKPLEYESIPGVTLGHRLIPVSSCGAYVPSGRYPLPSSALMSIIPAKAAGVRRVAACSPPTKMFTGIHPAVLVAMDIAGADEVYCMGGAQAIAAYAYGTATVPQVDLIVGPGNKFVTEAKRLISGSVGIDLLAGPSDGAIIADDSASPGYIAADLLATCEHDAASKAILITNSRVLAENVLLSINEQLQLLETAEFAVKTWEENGQIILAENLDEAVEIANSLAPEHLQLQTSCDDDVSMKLYNYGSLFIGSYAPVAFGDYVSGPNHILPTMGCARFTNGVWAGTFIKVAPYQKVNKNGAAKLAGSCAHLAGVEGLAAHRLAAELRKDG